MALEKIKAWLGRNCNVTVLVLVIVVIILVVVMAAKMREHMSLSGLSIRKINSALNPTPTCENCNTNQCCVNGTCIDKCSNGDCCLDGA